MTKAAKMKTRSTTTIRAVPFSRLDYMRRAGARNGPHRNAPRWFVVGRLVKAACGLPTIGTMLVAPLDGFIDRMVDGFAGDLLAPFRLPRISAAAVAKRHGDCSSRFHEVVFGRCNKRRFGAPFYLTDFGTMK
ncbi:hypothetical protein [Rhodanobacter sp. L36]|uniref:hypothetical protein n=1 Tax=Rhodanobacter sp. L36 TaxID=1747221 RepID=UPI00131B8F84|nr:hypothetical protein [Rhodanobacter sp. L36]